MYTGYSALAMAEALPADGEVVTLDIDSYLRDLNLQSFSASPHGSKIQIRIGEFALSHNICTHTHTHTDVCVQTQYRWTDSRN